MTTEAYPLQWPNDRPTGSAEAMARLNKARDEALAWLETRK